MNRTRKLLIPAVFLGMLANALATQAENSTPALQRQSVAELESRLTRIDKQLSSLAQYSLRSGVGAIGYRSQTHNDSAHREWIQINFDQEFTVDEIVLVPTILRDAEAGFVSDGFPLEFRVLVGVEKNDGTDDDETVIATFDADDRLLPRIAPVVVDCNGKNATWIRVEATKLSPRQFDGKFLLQFAEVLIFSGQENVAIGQPLQTSSNVPSGSPAWDASFVVDGFMPYLMNGAGGNESLAYVSEVGIGEAPSLTLDLETAHPVSQINLHLVDQSDTVPQTFTGDFGMPRLLLIEAANQADFSDGKLLDEFHHRSDFDTGPIIMRRFSATNCRYIRLTAKDPFIFSNSEITGSRIGFAEIEMIANGRNVALGKQVKAVFNSDHPDRSLVALTDGNNIYGQILSLRVWVAQLARRHDLETERPIVEAELNLRYQRQRIYVVWLIGLATLLAVAAFGAVAISWNSRERAIVKTRKRIAADLHDELGANFHAIGLLSDMAQSASNSPEKLNSLLNRIREVTERTGTAATYCVNMLESKGLYDNLVEEMRRSSARLMADLDHEIKIEGEEYLKQLNPRSRIDLFLFYKECLTNIIRHSGATSVATQLVADGKNVCLTVTDNGQGMTGVANAVPPSLKRRARLIGARVVTDHSGNSGTRIELRLPQRRLGISNVLGFIKGGEHE